MKPALSVYLWLDRRTSLSFRGKLFLMAFIGTHVPLVALVLFFLPRIAQNGSEMLWALGVTLAATLAGTGWTLFFLDRLLRPVVLTSRALRLYRTSRRIPALPTACTDDAGTLMYDAQRTIEDLERVREGLETMDPETGLPNRDGFLRGLDGRNLDGRGIILLRFGTFERLRSLFGDSEANRLTVVLAGKLCRMLEGDAFVGRVGDNILAFLARPIRHTDADRNALAYEVSGLLDDLSEEMKLEDLTVAADLTAGMAPFKDGGEGEVVFEQALSALGQAVRSAPVVLHSEAARDRARDRFTLEQDLRRAISAEELQLHYQPVMDVERRRPVAAEALLRWQSPSRGMVPPGSFIPVAEASGLIEEIGLWVLRRACQEAACWEQPMKVAVNLSAPQFLDPDLTWHIAEALEASRLPADRLEIELTESTAMSDHEFTQKAFHALRDLGVTIAIDDFGTGYASMSYLRRLPFHKLKIDREFVTDVDTSRGGQAICAALLELGRGLELDVQAEGTETAAEVAWLTSRGCRLFQGFHFCKPVPSRDFGARVAALAA